MTHHSSRLTIPKGFSTNSSADAYLSQIINAFTWHDLDVLAELLPEDSTYDEGQSLYEFLKDLKEEFDNIESEQPALHFPLMAVESKCFRCMEYSHLRNELVREGTIVTYSFIENSEVYNKLFSMVFNLDENGWLLSIIPCGYAFHSTLKMHQEEGDGIEPEEKSHW